MRLGYLCKLLLLNVNDKLNKSNSHNTEDKIKEIMKLNSAE